MIQKDIPEHEVRELVRTIVRDVPLTLEKLDIWDGKVDERWHSPRLYDVSSIYRHTERNPLIEIKKELMYIQFVTECDGPACKGILLYRMGPMGSYAREVICPTHMDRAERPHPQGTPVLFGNLQRDGKVYRNKLLHEAEIPLFFEGYGLNTWPGGSIEAKNLVRDITSKAAIQKGTLLVGGHGTGKTSLAAGILRLRITDYGNSGLFITASEYLQRLRPGIETDERMLYRIKRAEILVLDDLGAEKADTEWVLEQLWKLIAHRHDNKLCTIVTTNLYSAEIWKRLGEPPEARTDTLEDHLGERITQRFLDKDVFQIMMVRGDNLRTRGAQ